MELQNRNTTALTSTSHEQAIAVLLQEGFRQHKQGDLAAAQLVTRLFLRVTLIILMPCSYWVLYFLQKVSLKRR